MWTQIWARLAKEAKSEIRDAWNRALTKLSKAKIKWGVVTGPMQATIHTVMEWGWIPSRPDVWHSQDRAYMMDLNTTDFDGRAPRESALKEQELRTWKSAASHHLGKGLERGTPSLHSARRARKTIVKQQRYKEARSLDAVVCGGTWTAERTDEELTCFHCGARGTALHRYWQCKRHESSDTVTPRDTRNTTDDSHRERGLARLLVG